MALEQRRSHGPSRHVDGCACHRCAGTQPGNRLAVTHSAYALLALAPRAAEIADGLADVVPVKSLADGPVVQLLGLTLARVEVASAALEDLDRRVRNELSGYVVDEAAKMQRLREDMRGWVNTALRLADALALTPTSRARLGLDVLRGEATRLTLTRLAAMAEAEGDAT